MKLNVRLFATLKERPGSNTLSIELSDFASVETLLATLAAQVPALAPSLKTILVAVNNEYVFAEHIINPGDEIALFPPVSGG